MKLLVYDRTRKKVVDNKWIKKKSTKLPDIKDLIDNDELDFGEIVSIDLGHCYPVCAMMVEDVKNTTGLQLPFKNRFF